MKLFADYREDSKVLDIAKEVVKELDVKMEVLSLPRGDFLVTGGEYAVVVERKSAPDFVTSIRSNRMWEQLLELMKTESILDYPVKRRMVVIHGTINEYLNSIPTRISSMGSDSSRVFSSLMGAKMEIIWVYDTPVILAEDDEAFKAFLRILIKREAERKNDKQPSARWYRKRKSGDLPIKEKKRYTLASIPLIGESLADNLLSQFDSIAKIANASPKELQKVPGIGKKKAENIYEIFHG